MNPWKQERNRRIQERYRSLRGEGGKTVEVCKEVLSEEFQLGTDMIHKVLFDKAYKNGQRKGWRNGSAWLYLIQCKGFSLYKVGISDVSVVDRTHHLQTGCPFELVVKQSWEFPKPTVKDVETRVHKFCESKRVRPDGEWFKLSDRNIQALQVLVGKLLADRRSVI